MGEVTVEGDGVIKQEFTFEQLPEPLLIILSPPPAFLPAPGEPAMLWHNWLKAFDLYMDSIGEKALPDSSKCLLLQNCLGPEGKRIFRTLMPYETSYSAAIAVLTVYFTSDRTSQMYRLKFHHRTQRPGETVAQFVAALQELLRPCNYEDLKEQLILDQLIQNTKCPQLKERLLQEEETLTLDKALVLGKDVESELFSIHEVSVAIGDDFDPPVQKKAKRGRPRRGEGKQKTAAKPCESRTLRRSARCKANSHSTKTKTSPGDCGDEEHNDTDESPPTSKAGNDEAASSSQRREDDGSAADAAADNDSDTKDYIEDDDKKALNSSTNQKKKGLCCPLCVDRRFRDAHKLATHMKKHSKQNLIICPICNLTFSHSRNLTQHMRNKHGAGLYICPTCGEVLGSEAELKNHNKTHLSQVLTCPACQKVFTGNDALSSHILTHGNDQLAETAGQSSQQSNNVANKEIIDGCIGECSESDDCDNKAAEDGDQSGTNDSQVKVSKVRVKTDINEAQPPGGGSQKDNDAARAEKGYFCPICVGRRFRGQNKLDRHMRMHTKEKPFSCPICAGNFSQSYHMIRHLRNQHNVGQYICSKCGHGLSSMVELKTHMKTHVVESLKCFACQKQFKEKSALATHLKFHKKVQSSSSRRPTCGEVLGSENELEIHKKTHLSQVLTCPACQKVFTDNDAFSSHILTHGNDQLAETAGQSSQQSSEVAKKEIIDGCIGECSDSDDCDSNAAEDSDQSDTNDSQVKVSKVRVDTDDSDINEAQPPGGDSQKDNDAARAKKGYFCPICINRRFRGQYQLDRHMRMHTQEKPFSCPMCDVTFSQSYHMIRHLRNQHAVGQYICSKCGHGLGSMVELRMHKKTHVIESLTCFACQKQFKEKSALANHLKFHKTVQSSSSRHLTCGDCGKVFGRLYHLKRHIMTHRKKFNSESYTCPDCQKTFAFPEDLNKHLESHVKETNGMCPKCDKTFDSAEDLETHMKGHEKSYHCNICSKIFKVEYALKKHILSHQEEQYYCSLCDKHFIKLSHYKRHLLVHNRRESKCPHCNRVFLKLTAFKYHLRTHVAERPHQCTCCVETFEEKEALEQHCLKHRKFKKQRPYSCTRCDYAFCTLIELTEHMRAHEGEPPSCCPICGKTFLNKKKLEKHLSIHTGERPHLCSICGNGFPSAGSLKLHMHIHTGEKPYQCTQCTKSFKSSSGLRLHSRQHMEVRPSYECPQCGRTYGRMTELKMHQRNHTGDKPFACTCCNKRFITKDKLNVHMRIHTGERPYSCYYCGQTFTQTGDRNRHIAKFHLLESAVNELQ